MVAGTVNCFWARVGLMATALVLTNKEAGMENTMLISSNVLFAPRTGDPHRLWVFSVL